MTIFRGGGICYLLTLIVMGGGGKIYHATQNLVKSACACTITTVKLYICKIVAINSTFMKIFLKVLNFQKK